MDNAAQQPQAKIIDLAKLAAPFPPDQISWRVGSTTKDKSKGMALAYIDSRDVQNRLDDVCGAENWQVRFPWSDGKALACEIGIRINGEWIWKGDGAGATDVEADKGRFSDAMKRAAVHWKIGRYLYDIDSPWVALEAAGNSYKIAATEHAKLRALLARDARQSAPPAESQRPKPVETPASAQQPAMVDGIDVPLIVDGAKEHKTLKALGEWVNENAGMLGEIAKKARNAYDAVASGIFLHALTLCNTQKDIDLWVNSKARNTLTSQTSEATFEVLDTALVARRHDLKANLRLAG